jgi:hypothetical protein
MTSETQAEPLNACREKAVESSKRPKLPLKAAIHLLIDDLILAFALLFKNCPEAHLLDIVLFRYTRNLQKLRQLGVLSILHAPLLDLLSVRGAPTNAFCALPTASYILWSAASSDILMRSDDSPGSAYQMCLQVG